MKLLDPTISDLERDVQHGLEALRQAPLNEVARKALDLLVPPGYRPIVELQEDRRKKRRTAAGSNWSPDSGEIFIYFEPLNAQPVTATLSPEIPSGGKTAFTEEITDMQVDQCCDALAEAEKTGRQFIALKWFRDTALVNAGFEWSSSADLRQRVLGAAIEQDAIQTKRIPNPKSALHPTTVISLKRLPSMPSRFKPIPLSGSTLASEQLLKDRG